MPSSRFLAPVLLIASVGFAVSEGDPQASLQRRLFDACRSDDARTVEKLLSEGADPKTPLRNTYPEWPLHVAIQNKHTDLVRLLANRGAPLNHTQPSAIAVATSDGNVEMIDLLISLGADVNAQDGDAIIEASGKSLALVLHLIQAGAKPCRPALANAVRFANLDVFEHLLAAGIDPQSRDEDGRSLLHDAASRGWFENNSSTASTRLKMWSRLLGLGCSIDAHDHHGRTPLLDASSLESLSWLIRHNADVNAQDEDGNSLLLELAAYGSAEMVRFALTAGADHRHRNQAGKDALDLAIQAARWPIVATLLREGVEPTRPESILTKIAQTTLDQTTSMNHISWIALRLVDFIGDVRGIWVGDLPILFWAILMDDLALTQRLLEAGAEIDAETTDGLTPLMIASLTGREKIHHLLVEAGAETPLRKAHQGPGPTQTVRKTPLEEVDAAKDEHPTSNEPSDVFEAIAANRLDALQQFGKAEPSSLTAMRGGIQPIHLAAALGHRPMVAWLQAQGVPPTV